MKNVGIIGVPLRYGQSIAGVDKGPVALRTAGIQSVLEKFTDVVDYGDVQIKEYLKDEANKKLKNLSLIHHANQELFDKVISCIEDGLFPLVIGGDHALAIGSVAAVASRFADVGLIWFDAHSDINTEVTTPSGNIHGMSLACLLGHGQNALLELIPVKVKPENVVLIGVRSMDPGEVKLVKELNIKLFTTEDVRNRGMKEVIDDALCYLSGRCHYLHLSFDLDSLDPLVCPGVGVPERDGLSLEEARQAVKKFGESVEIQSMDLVELNPMLDQDRKTQNIALEVLETFFMARQKITKKKGKRT